MTTCKYPPKPKRGKKIETASTGVIYARYSSHSQRDISIEQQIAKCQELAEEYGIKIVEVYADRAVSGRTDQRKDFQKMMQDLHTLQPTYVIAWKSNRIGRNMSEAMMNETKFIDIGARILYVEEDFDDSAAGRFAARSMMNVNQFYSDAMSEDIKRGMLDNAEKCLVNGPVAFGYCKGEDGRYVIDPEKADVVREIYNRFLSGDTYAAIARDLNSRGIRTKLGNLWNKGSFHRMLQNETYTGVYYHSGIRKEGGVPAIITKDMFHAAQERLKNKPNPVGCHRTNSNYLLTGKLFCGHCGAPMVGICGTSKNGTKYHYYTCHLHHLKKNCDTRNVRRDYIEDRVIKKTKEYLSKENVINNIRTQSLLTTYEKDLKDVNQSLNNILRAIEQGIFTDTMGERLKELEDKRRQLQSNIATEKDAFIEVPKEQMQLLLESLRNGEHNDLNTIERMIKFFVKSIYIFDSGNTLQCKIFFKNTGNNDTLEFFPTDIDAT